MTECAIDLKTAKEAIVYKLGIDPSEVKLKPYKSTQCGCGETANYTYAGIQVGVCELCGSDSFSEVDLFDGR